MGDLHRTLACHPFLLPTLTPLVLVILRPSFRIIIPTILLPLHHIIPFPRV